MVSVVQESSLTKILGGQLFSPVFYDVYQDSKNGPDSTFLKLQDAMPRLSIGKMAISRNLSAIRRFIDVSDRDQARRSAMLLQVALQLFHREQGEFPESLELLVPTYLEVLPQDPFGNGEPLRYRREGRHAVIYSLGQDGIDEGGEKIPEDRLPRVDLWDQGDPRFDVYAPGEKAQRKKFEPVKAERR